MARRIVPATAGNVAGQLMPNGGIRRVRRCARVDGREIVGFDGEGELVVAVVDDFRDLKLRSLKIRVICRDPLIFTTQYHPDFQSDGAATVTRRPFPAAKKYLS